MPELKTRYSKDESTITSVGTSFNTSKYATLSVDTNHFQEFFGNFQGLFINVSSISSATKLTMRLTKDLAGDDILIPDTEADIATGLTTANKGQAAFGIDLDVYSDVEIFYVFFKVDAGSLTVDKTVFTYRREL